MLTVLLFGTKRTIVSAGMCVKTERATECEEEKGRTLGRLYQMEISFFIIKPAAELS